MSLTRYWPTRKEVNRCIKAEAESAHDAVLLAVHQPMPLIRRDEGSGVEAQVSEHDLLEAFLSDDLPEGTLLVPITGPSGAGKSHLIRWLAAQLGRDPRARHMHVIRIPKSASLRDVVERMLEPLAEDPRYADVRSSLDKAISQVSPLVAAVRFSGALEIALGGLKNRLIAKLKNNPPESECRDLRRRAHHATKLPGFFNDAALRDHMTNHLLAPIIQRAVSGRMEVEPGEEDLLPQFEPDDLRVPDKLKGAIGEAAKEVQTYYLSGLNADGGAGRLIAAGVLNDVVDEAIQQVFQLDQATGGVTLQSVILRVRELLLQDGRELVLLVEDFAALSGIQQVLLDVCIHEAEREGSQVRSRMRTALALTDGYLVDRRRSTIATRAKREWIIQSNIQRDDVLDRSVNLIGAYLNAARWGEKTLIDLYQKSPRKSEADLTTWIEIFEDDDLTPEASDQLATFGTTNSGISLFPYNELAIVELARRHLREAGELSFNPRRIINVMLRNILLSGRGDFEQGKFPPNGFEDATASASLDSWLADEQLSDADRQRMKALFVYWGGNPSGPEQAADIPTKLFQAFGMQRPMRLAKPTKSKPRPTPPPSPQPEPAPKPRTDDWRQKLDAWSGGIELTQQEANKIRSVLRPPLEKAIPWNRLRLTKQNLKLLLIIPNARGNDGPAAIRIAIAKDHKDPHGQLRQAILGALRLDESKGRLDYAGAEEDSALVATLIERLVADLIPLLEQPREQEVRLLSWILRREARVLGLVPRARMPAFDCEVRGIRAQVDAESQRNTLPAEESRWQQLQREATEMRPELQHALCSRIGCFQGDGKTVYALDPTLLELSDDIERFDMSFLENNQRAHLSQFKPVRLASAVRPLIKQLKELSGRLDDLLGITHDKQGLLSGLGKLLDALEPIGVWHDEITRSQLKRAIESFRNDDLMKQLEEAAPLLDTTSEIDLSADSTLLRLGRLNFAVIERAEAFLSELETFIAAVENELNVKERELTGIDPDADAKTLEGILEQVDRDLCIITGDTPA